MSARPSAIRAAQPLARLTTIGTGGPAELFARASSAEELAELSAWARAQAIDLNVVGSGSNLLVADDGVAGLVVKLDGALGAIELDDGLMVCGGGARLPSVAAAAARAGLAGIEFGVNIPGSVGGAVRMNANAYGGRLDAVLEWAEVIVAGRLERRLPGELGFAYRSSALRDGEIVARVALRLEDDRPEDVRARLEQLRARRHEAQPQGIRTFGSTFKNPSATDAQGATAGRLLARAGCNGLSVGDARFAPKHANFIENLGAASTSDVLALMDAGRERVREHAGVALEPEVHTLGGISFPWELRG